ncbi:MAG: CDGSH iron-sulfur domain-containing protein [Thermoanaerobaculia bacterium]
MKITVRNNGSLKIEGESIDLVDQEGRPYGLAGRTVISLCRCGMSQKKPFCDGSHNNGFASLCEAHDLPAPVAKT